MEEIKVGEYVKLRDGEITRIDKVEDNTFKCKFHKINCELYIDFIVKHSPNLIDLIEEGDYVNGYKVLDVVENMKTGELHLEMPMDYTNPELGDCTIYNKDIKNIVTKEQFEKIKYIVGG